MISREVFERMEGLTSIKDTNLLVNALARLSKDLFEEGFEKEEIIEYFQKVIEMEVESALDVVVVESEVNGIDTSGFQVGDILVFDGVGAYVAKKGAKAIYEGSFEQWGEEWIKVKWIDDKANGQGDGGYLPENFTKVD
jgi:hypothetical protein